MFFLNLHPNSNKITNLYGNGNNLKIYNCNKGFIRIADIFIKSIITNCNKLNKTKRKNEHTNLNKIPIH